MFDALVFYYTPLQIAVLFNNSEIVQILLSRNDVDVNAIAIIKINSFIIFLTTLNFNTIFAQII